MVRRPAIALTWVVLAVASCHSGEAPGQSGEAPGGASSDATQEAAATAGAAPAAVQGSPDWGPLAVAEFTGEDEALITGTVRITDACALLDDGEERVLLVWPEPQVDWLSARNAIEFISESGVQTVLHDGDPVTLSGGGSAESEDGLARGDFLKSMAWVARPHPDCVVSSRWSIGDVVSR